MTKLSFEHLHAVWGAIEYKLAYLEGLHLQILPFIPPDGFEAHDKVIDNVYKEVARLKEAKTTVSKVYEEMHKS